MNEDRANTAARPVFRKLALALSVLCFLLALLFRFTTPEQGKFPVIISILVGFILLVIGRTGRWPPKS